MRVKRKLCKKVAPKSAKEIRALALEFRDLLGQKKSFIKITHLLEVLQDMEFLEFEVVNDQILGDQEAVSYPDKSFMQIRQSVYDNAHKGNGHCRFTIAHELGHLLMHKNQARFARGSEGNHKIFEDSEWQADTFASEFLIDQRLLKNAADVYEVSNLFGVSHSAAAKRLDMFRKGK